MGKRTGVKKQRPSPAHVPLVVNSLEVGAAYGCLTLRSAGYDPASRPQCLAIPHETLPGVFDNLTQALAHAEEDYWNELRRARAATKDDPDPEAVPRSMERVLKRQGWQGVLNHAGPLPTDSPTLLLLTHAGHVALYATPPLCRAALFAVYDPLQLLRQLPAIQRAAAGAREQHQRLPAAPVWQRLQWALDYLEGSAWDLGGYVPPTRGQAVRSMDEQWTSFLARAPYLLPEDRKQASRQGAAGGGRAQGGGQRPTAGA